MARTAPTNAEKVMARSFFIAATLSLRRPFRSSRGLSLRRRTPEPFSLMGVHARPRPPNARETKTSGKHPESGSMPNRFQKENPEKAYVSRGFYLVAAPRVELGTYGL